MPDWKKNTSAVRETDVSRHNEGPIEGTPQYHSAVMYEGFEGGGPNQAEFGFQILFQFGTAIKIRILREPNREAISAAGLETQSRIWKIWTQSGNTQASLQPN